MMGGDYHYGDKRGGLQIALLAGRNQVSSCKVCPDGGLKWTKLLFDIHTGKIDITCLYDCAIQKKSKRIL